MLVLSALHCWVWSHSHHSQPSLRLRMETHGVKGLGAKEGKIFKKELRLKGERRLPNSAPHSAWWPLCMSHRVWSAIQSADLWAEIRFEIMCLKGACGTAVQGRALLGHRLRGDRSWANSHRPVNKWQNTAANSPWNYFGCGRVHCQSRLRHLCWPLATLLCIPCLLSYCWTSHIYGWKWHLLKQPNQPVYY